MQGWLTEARLWAILLLPLAIAAIGWAVRTGLASRREMEAADAAEREARQKAVAEVEVRLSDRLAAVDRRLLQVETDIKHLPTAEDVGELKDRLADVDAQGKWTAGMAEDIKKVVGRIEDYLLKNKPN